MKFAIITKALVALYSFVQSVSSASADSTASGTIEYACYTAYGSKPVSPVPISTRLTYTTIYVTLTKALERSTSYVTKEDETKTITRKVTETYSTTAKTFTLTITKLVIYTREVPGVHTITYSVTIKTITPTPTTSPTPRGFLNASDDPVNNELLDRLCTSNNNNNIIRKDYNLLKHHKDHSTVPPYNNHHSLNLTHHYGHMHNDESHKTYHRHSSALHYLPCLRV
ncbi:hypothetical protein ABW20_dc0100675 [Dactylellina cionopaga]|nr:hypothetical protein ABW20_dc0100675 [Dactylellina cionopaga]